MPYSFHWSRLPIEIVVKITDNEFQILFVNMSLMLSLVDFIILFGRKKFMSTFTAILVIEKDVSSFYMNGDLS